MLLLAIGIGLVSGSVCIALRLLLKLLQVVFTGHSGLLPDAAAHLSLWRRAITPVAGAALALFIARVYQRRRPAKRFQEYVEAVRLEDGRIEFIPTLWQTLNSVVSVSTGAAIGREGSMIQFAAGVTSWLGRSWIGRNWSGRNWIGPKMTDSVMHLPRLVAWGVAAAVAAVYQAPIAGAFFAAEIVIGRIALNELPFLLISAFSASFASRVVLGSGPIFRAPGPLHFDLSHIGFALGLAILLGVLGPAYRWLIRRMRYAEKLPLALVWSGATVGVISLFQTEVWGNGDGALLHVMQGPVAVFPLVAILILRIFATAFCVGTGTVGGVFTPTLFTGGAVGLLFGQLLHLPNPVVFAVLGMSCMLAAVTRAPWMASFMAAELTGQMWLLPMLLLSSLVAWQVAKRLSPYSLYALATPEPADDQPLVEHPPTRAQAALSIS
jgi:CIC family chloride channel protein